MLDILKGERPQITNDTPEFYAELMKKRWDHNPENRPTAEEIQKCFEAYRYSGRTIILSEVKRQEIIRSDKFLLDTKNYKHHPESYYTSRSLNELIERAESLNLSSTEIGSKNYYIEDRGDNKSGLLDILYFSQSPTR